MAETLTDWITHLVESGRSGVTELKDGSRVLQDSRGNKLVLSGKEVGLMDDMWSVKMYLENQSHISEVNNEESSKNRWKDLEKGMEIFERAMNFVDEESKLLGNKEKIDERNRDWAIRVTEVEGLRAGYQYRQEHRLPGLGEQVSTIRRLITSGQNYGDKLKILSEQKDSGKHIESLRRIVELCEELDEMGKEKDLDGTNNLIQEMMTKFGRKSKKSAELDEGLVGVDRRLKELIDLQEKAQSVKKNLMGVKELAMEYGLEVDDTGMPKNMGESVNRVSRLIASEVVGEMEDRMDGVWGNDLSGLRVDLNEHLKHKKEVQAYIDTNNVAEAVRISMEYILRTVAMDVEKWKAGMVSEAGLIEEQERDRQEETELKRELEMKNETGSFDFIPGIKKKREEEVKELQIRLGATRNKIRMLGWQRDVLFELGFGKKFLSVLEQD